jgi:DNA topoisomerase I
MKLRMVLPRIDNLAHNADQQREVSSGTRLAPTGPVASRRQPSPGTTPERLEAAAAAGLRYVSDYLPGIRRRRAGSGFVYTAPDGKPLRDARTIQRVKSLVIPPAWTDVWICPFPNGHIQATGRDARRRKQFIYHRDWRSTRDAAKFANLGAFGDALYGIRKRVAHDLRLGGLPRHKVMATVVRLLDETSIRVGNEEYRRQNHSFGLTTLRDRHITVDGPSVRFEFRGKSGKRHSLEINDKRVAHILKVCQEIPGQELFQYLDEDGGRHTVASDDVNAYLREISGGEFTAKDFRTWNGTVLALRYLGQCPPCATARETKHTITQAMTSVSTHLGNTPATCRKAYVHPAVIQAFTSGNLTALIASAARPDAHEEVERCLLELLRADASQSVGQAA